MQTQIFNVQSVEIVLCHMIQDFSQTGNSSAWKDIFLDPWITRMFFQCTDKMKQEQSTWFQNFLHAIKKQLIIVTANMLQHTNTDNTVKLILFLGAPAALYLAAAGVGTIGIADADEVDLSNLQRQVIHTTADVGKLKVESAAETMKAINPDVTVNTYHTFVDSSNIMDLIKDYDFILDGTDNFPAKFLINDACVMAEKPFSHAGIIRFQGQLMTYVPGQGPCYRCAFQSPPPKDAVPTCKQAGVIGAMGGVIGSLQAMEAIKYIIGQGDLLTGRLLTYDALKMTFRTVKLPKNHHCPVCGDNPTITELIDYEQAVCELKH